MNPIPERLPVHPAALGRSLSRCPLQDKRSRQRLPSNFAVLPAAARKSRAVIPSRVNVTVIPASMPIIAIESEFATFGNPRKKSEVQTGGISGHPT